MKNLTEYINESLVNESLIALTICCILLGFQAICHANLWMVVNNREPEDMPKLLQPLHFGWWADKIGAYMDKKRAQKDFENYTKKQQEMVKALSEDKEFQDWLASDKQLIKELKPICRRVATEIGFAISSIEDKARALAKEYKVSDKEIKEAE
jgi:hypothetical protein